MAAVIMEAGNLLGIITTLINSGVESYGLAQKISALIAQRKAEGRPFTRSDLDVAVGADDTAKAKLEAAIARAGG